MKCCRNCGQVLNGNEKYCPNCGNFIRKKYKIQSFLVVSIVLIAVSLLGISLIIGLYGRKTSEQVTVSANEEYTKIFKDRNIEDSSDLEVMSGREIREYVTVDDAGIVGKIEFAYVDNAIIYVVETCYYPMEGFNKRGIKNFDRDIKAETKELDELDFVDITYEMKEDYYMLKINYKYVDNYANLSALEETGIVWWAGEADYVSARAMKDALRDAGYILK